MQISSLGDHARKVKEDNVNRIRQFFVNNPDATQKDCEKILELSYSTILRHVKTLRKEKIDKD